MISDKGHMIADSLGTEASSNKSHPGAVVTSCQDLTPDCICVALGYVDAMDHPYE